MRDRGFNQRVGQHRDVEEGGRLPAPHAGPQAISNGRYSSKLLMLSFSGFQGLCVFSFICHCARARAGVAFSCVGLSPASAAAMVCSEKAYAIWGALRDCVWLSGLVLVLIGLGFFRKNFPSKQSTQSCNSVIRAHNRRLI